MEDRGTCVRKLLQPVENRGACTATMDGHDSPAGVAALRKDLLEKCNLEVPMLAVRGIAVKAYFSHVTGIWKNALEEPKLTPPLVSELRMKA
jgi:hypothetical protein